MIRITFAFILLLFSAFSCSKDEEYVNPMEPLEKFPAYVSRVEAPETAKVGSTVPIKIYFTVNNGCGKFNYFKVEKKNDATFIEVYPKYRDGFCTMDLPTREAIYEFKPTAAGIYTFKFSPLYPDQIITKTIQVSSDGL